MRLTGLPPTSCGLTPVACDPDGDIPLLLQYMRTDPARCGDWTDAVQRALGDDDAANPDHKGGWRDRGEMPE